MVLLMHVHMNLPMDLAAPAEPVRVPFEHVDSQPVRPPVDDPPLWRMVNGDPAPDDGMPTEP